MHGAFFVGLGITTLPEGTTYYYVYIYLAIYICRLALVSASCKANKDRMELEMDSSTKEYFNALNLDLYGQHKTTYFVSNIFVGSVVSPGCVGA